MEKYIATLKTFYENNKDKIKIAALPVIIVVAILFFWVSGGQEENLPLTKEKDDMDSIKSSYAEDEKAESSQSENQGEKNRQEIYVDIGGNVKDPGVYKVPSGTRLFEVITLAGGLTPSANVIKINQAKEVFDGEKIIIPSDEKAEKNSISHYIDGDTTSQDISNHERVNLNHADSVTLQSIPGIGPSKAEKIIDYREKNGGFKKIEDIKNISGIGEHTFESIKEYITI